MLENRRQSSVDLRQSSDDLWTLRKSPEGFGWSSLFTFCRDPLGLMERTGDLRRCYKLFEWYSLIFGRVPVRVIFGSVRKGLIIFGYLQKTSQAKFDRLRNTGHDRRQSCNLHSYHNFALTSHFLHFLHFFHLNYTCLSQSESSNIFKCISEVMINTEGTRIVTIN